MNWLGERNMTLQVMMLPVVRVRAVQEHHKPDARNSGYPTAGATCTTTMKLVAGMAAIVVRPPVKTRNIFVVITNGSAWTQMRANPPVNVSPHRVT